MSKGLLLKIWYPRVSVLFFLDLRAPLYISALFFLTVEADLLVTSVTQKALNHAILFKLLTFHSVFISIEDMHLHL